MCEFSGKFVVTGGKGSTVYTLKVTNFKYTRTPGTVCYKDGIYYDVVETTEIGNGSLLEIYLPGTTWEQMDVECYRDLSLWAITQDKLLAGQYVICNPEAGAAYTSW